MALATILVTQLLLAGGAYVLALGAVSKAERARQESDAKLCAVVQLIVDPGGPPPSTERGRQLARAMDDLAQTVCRDAGRPQ